MTFDEAGFRLVPVYRRVWFIKGKKPKGVFFWSNKKSNIIGALIDGKKLYYKWHESLNTLTFLGFLKVFIKQLPKGKYVFIFDNASYHKSSTIRQIACPHHQSVDWWHARLTSLASAGTLSLQPVKSKYLD